MPFPVEFILIGKTTKKGGENYNMTKIQKKFASAIAAGAMLFNVTLPVLASTSLVISGNGADSDNETDVKINTTTNVVQTNSANISNYVKADADTGNNEANKNTGGDVKVETGDAATLVSVENTANKNVAEVDGCCDMDVDVLISGNGYDSKNDAKLRLDNATNVVQTNTANIKNYVKADADTGGNEANKNTGGDITVKTGDATTGVSISNTANANSAKIGGGSGAGSLSMWILENGADTRNKIKLYVDRDLNVVQTNNANIKNYVKAYADTGDNEANKNTGGEVEIETGDALAGVMIDNMVNFNAADVDCGCLMDVLAKIAGNGYDSKNKIKAYLNDDTNLFQTNYADLKNKVKADADTGDNEANKNTGGVDGSDPSVYTGDAETYAEVENTSNLNEVGSSGSSWSFPTFGGYSFNLNISFSLAQLLAALGV